jgi:hypothetical protein
MTAYFDSRHKQVTDLRERCRNDFTALTDLEQMEDAMLFDINLLCSFPDFPVDIAEAIQLTIADFATEPLSTRWRSYDDDTDKVFTQIQQLIWDLHTHFHTLANRQLGFSDSPASSLRIKANGMEDKRVALMRTRERFAEQIAAHDKALAEVGGE